MALTLFAYRRGSSVLHKAPAFAKLLFLFALCIFTYHDGMSVSWNQLFSWKIVIKTSACLFASLALFFLSGAKWNSIRQLKFVLVIGGFVTLMKLVDFPFRLDKDALAYGILYTVRFFISSLAAQVVFETTSSLQIKEAMESVQDGISRIIPQIKKWNPALAVSLAINFIPEIFETWSKVGLAVKARTQKKSKGKIKILVQRFSTFFSCLLHNAQTKRMAVLNRSKISDE